MNEPTDIKGKKRFICGGLPSLFHHCFCFFFLICLCQHYVFFYNCFLNVFSPSLLVEGLMFWGHIVEVVERVLNVLVSYLAACAACINAATGTPVFPVETVFFFHRRHIKRRCFACKDRVNLAQIDIRFLRTNKNNKTNNNIEKIICVFYIIILF